MNKQNNLYNYRTPKSGNEETSYFLTKGRITIRSFFLRLLLCIFIYIISYFVRSYFLNKYWSVYDFEAQVHVTDETIITFYTLSKIIHFYITPAFLIIFIFIQGAKRMHDVNKSGWNFLIPFYNLYLAFLPGTKGNNDYGIDFNTTKNTTYFDELEVFGENENTISKVKSSIKVPIVTDFPQSKSNTWIYAFLFIFLVAIIAWYSSKNNNIQSTNLTAESISIDSNTIVKDSSQPANAFNDSDVAKTKDDKNNIIWLNDINGYFIDERDGNKYEVLKVGKQIWMADNLRYRSDESVSLKCDDSNDKYGRLYNWDDANEVAPKGWHLPTKKEYDQLLRNFSESEMLASNYFNAYSSGQALLSTERCSDQFPQFDEYIAYWSATPYGNEVAWALQYYDTGFLMTWSDSYRKGRIENGSYYGVRCVLDKEKIKINW